VTTKREPDPIYCKDCGYSLREITSRQCPECGRRFDPSRPITYATSPREADRNWSPLGIVAFAASAVISPMCIVLGILEPVQRFLPILMAVLFVALFGVWGSVLYSRFRRRE